jgi:excisionase family DNA binding protein
VNEVDIPSIDLHEAAEMLGVTWKTARKWVATGKLKAVMVGGRYRLRPEWIQAAVKPVEVPLVSEERSESDVEVKARSESMRRFFKARFGIDVQR